MRSELPIDRHLAAIAQAVENSGGAIVVAEPGAGKTTRVPAMLLDTIGVPIVCTQPRRIAARLSAKRVAEERNTKLGDEVGYEVRFDRKISATTRLRFLTEGLALRQWNGQRKTRRILILDEFHERHLDADILLSLALHERTQGSDLAIVVMSATLDPQPVSDFLGGLPIIVSEGRHFPIEHRYVPPRDREPLETTVSRALRQLLADPEQSGDILLFLPGAAEINRCQKKLSELATQRDLVLLPLHGGLRPAQQDLALSPNKKQKVILATNVAETSVTIEGVTAVIDCGTARIARHSPWTGLASLQVEPVSQASAKQRAGRAGRTAPGICIHLYNESDLLRRPAFDTPEISRSDLTACALNLAQSGTCIEQLSWLDTPPTRARQAAHELLERLGATSNGILTTLGKRMGQLPIHPRLARLVLAAEDLGIPKNGARAAGILSERPLRHSQRRGQQASAASCSDVLDDLDVLEELRSSNFRPNAARATDADLQTARNIERTSEQILRTLRHKTDRPDLSQSDRDIALRQALLAGFPDRAGRRTKPKSSSVLLCQGGAVTLSQSSAVIHAEYLLAIDVESRGRAGGRSTIVRVASEIDPTWLLDMDGIVDIDEHQFDAGMARVVRRTGIYYGDIAIDEEVIVDPSRISPVPAADALRTALLDGQLRQIVDVSELAAYRLRLQFVANHTQGMQWPVLNDAYVASTLLGTADRPTRLSDLQNGSIVDALHWSLSEEQRKTLERMAPTHIAIPGRKRVPIHYEIDRSPWIESRLQDFFGASEGPSLCDGTVPLTLHLLAPNRRAVQVTTDLIGFWTRHYPALRKQLMRRYPRHKWPEKP